MILQIYFIFLNCKLLLTFFELHTSPEIISDNSKQSEVSRHEFFFLILLQKLFMIPILLCITSGILTGYLFRKSGFVKHTGILLSLVIMLLLFFLGVSVGNNEQIIDNFASIGLEAFILTAGGTLGSILCAKWVFERFFAGRKSRPEKNTQKDFVHQETCGGVATKESKTPL